MAITIASITGAAKSYLDIFFRRKWLFLTPTLICCGLAIAWSFTIPPKYRSSTIVLVEEEKVSNPLISGLAVSTTVKDRLPTITKILLSRPLLEQVIRELNLDKGLNSSLEIESLIEALRNNISVQLIGMDILKVTVEDRNPEICQKLANAITTLFIKHNLELQTKETNAGIEFLKNQKEIYEKKLKDAEKALREFKEKHQVELSMKASQEIAKLVGTNISSPLVNVEVLRHTEYRDDLIKLNLQLKEALNRKEQLEKQLSSEKEYIAYEKLVDPVIKQLEQDLVEKQVSLAKLEVDATQDHPLVIRYKREIEELKKKIQERKSQSLSGADKEILNPIYQEIKQELMKIEREIESLKTRIKLTELYLQEHIETIKNIPKQEEELANLQRDYNINAQIYADLTARLETAYITQRLELQEKGTKFRIIESAKVPLKPFKPNRKFMAFAGTGLGMLIGIGLIFLVEMTDHSFTEVNQLRNFLNIPVLGSISQILTVEEAEEIKARKRFWILCLFMFIIFSIAGAVIKYLLSKGA